jgi:hypothetical protein
MKYAICINNRGYEASLDERKIYRVLAEPDAEQHGWLRIIDESGEDYLFEATRFVPIELPAAAEEIFKGEPTPA